MRDWTPFREAFGERFTTSQGLCDQHGQAESFYPAMPPEAVLFAQSTEDVACAVKLCTDRGIPVTPFGAGTSLEGNFLPVRGGLCIDLSRMNRVLRVSGEDLDCTIEPGVTRIQLNTELRDTGLFFPVDPGADATLGGMASTRASGTNAVRYGTMRQNVLALKVVLPSGEIIHTGSRARKSAAGYDLTGLFVGAEGTLGIITELTLRLYGQPEAIGAAVCEFESLHGAVNAVIQTVQMGIPVARIELLDALQIKAVNAFSNAAYRECPTLFLEFHGTPASVAEQSAQFGEIAADHSGGNFAWTAKAEERTAMWSARHNVHYANLALRPGSRTISTDVCVPISCLGDCIADTRAAIEESGLTAPIVGHVGDGNFHVVMVIDPASPEELARASALSERIVELAFEHGGTCTGEHGIGIGKKQYLLRERGEAVDVMRVIKRALDPAGLMNPGKVFDMI